jgi:flagellar motor switch protein FliN/FliY
MSDTVVQPLNFESLLASESVGSSSVPQDMSLVEHVAVKLTAVLGHADITVGELFRLGQGAVLPLREYLDEPIVLKLDGRAVATAHLVAVGDHFGVRIAEIL